ncbi:Utp14-domain-containing protein [Patellaria atrata CBS 101060]|uniref:Utp14-domain-containing protein n=1 Tax=Patellaria atrata CBS 101060 TaxID=1346257 RepID=A0A9P4SFX8_9PEZI|nr:Utp14-domain-containing protein [Patellaria atrata CBS 101060]
MPPRIARSSVSISKIRTSRKKNQKRTLDAFSIATAQNPERIKVRQHRLGEAEAEDPRRKRQRLADDQESEHELPCNPLRVQRKSVTKGRFDELDISSGSDSEGNTWRYGQVEEDNDSELDSDEAFGESDEERFEGFTFRGSSSGTQKARDKTGTQNFEEGDKDVGLTLDEGEGDRSRDDEDSEDSLGDDAVDLATVLDQYENDEPLANRKHEKDAVEDQFKSFENEDDSEDSASTSDDERVNPVRLSKLRNLISSLDEDQTTSSQKLRIDNAQEARPPSEFGLATSHKLTIDDLLPTVTDPALKRSLKLLRKDTKPSKRNGIPGKLEAPLPKRQQDRLDRIATSKKANEEISDRWIETVKHQRRVKHIAFPIKYSDDGEVQGTHKLLPTSESTPLNELENAIQNIMQESGMLTLNSKSDEDRIRAFEELQTNKMPVEEVLARRAELRKARDLLFREEVRAKRIKKIKSKAYRRVHRKERERNAEKDRAELIAEGVDVSENEREYNDRRRAEERMGAKHRESKWAKEVKQSGRTFWDEDARAGVTEMARRNEELRRRIEGKDYGDNDGDASDVSSGAFESDVEDDEELQVRKLQRQLGRTAQAEDDDEPKTSNLSSMQFMRRAEAARKARNDEDVERMRRELAGEETPSADENENSTSVGRRIFGPMSKVPVVPVKQKPLNEFEKHLPSEDESDYHENGVEIVVSRHKSSDEIQNPGASSRRSGLSRPSKVKAEVSSEPLVNPWITQSRKGVRFLAEKDDSSVEAGHQGSSSSQKQQSMSSVAEKEVPAKAGGWMIVTYSREEDEEQSDASEGPNLPFVLRSSDLVQKAFAGDEVAADFEAEKKATIAEEDDKLVDETLPGWGTWTGEGLSKQQKKRNKGRFLTKEDGIKPEQRKDAKLAKVIINEKRIKKNARYLATSLPHPFENRQQYERSMRLPVGPEWTTKATFQDATRPRITIKQGSIIKPLAKPLV